MINKEADLPVLRGTKVGADVARVLDSQFPSAMSREVVEYEGGYYQRRFGDPCRSHRNPTLWDSWWEILPEGHPDLGEFQLEQQYRDEVGKEFIFSGTVNWVTNGVTGTCPNCRQPMVKGSKVLRFEHDLVSRGDYFTRKLMLHQYGSTFRVCTVCSMAIIAGKLRLATDGEVTNPRTHVLKDGKDVTRWPVHVRQRFMDFDLS